MLSLTTVLQVCKITYLGQGLTFDSELMSSFDFGILGYPIIQGVKKPADQESLYLEKYHWLKNDWYVIQKRIVDFL